MNTVDEARHPENSANFLQSVKFYGSDYSSGLDDTVALNENGKAKIEPLNMLIKIGNFSTTLLVNSGSACSILNRSLVSQVVKALYTPSGSTRKSAHNSRNSPMNQYTLKEKYNPQIRATAGPQPL